MRLKRVDGTTVGVHRRTGRGGTKTSDYKGLPDRTGMLELLRQSLEGEFGFRGGRWHRTVEERWVLVMDEMEMYGEIRRLVSLVHEGFNLGFYEGTHGIPLAPVTDAMLKHYDARRVVWYERHLRKLLALESGVSIENPFGFRV